MIFRLSPVVLVFALVVLGAPVKRGADEVQSDIENIARQVKALDSSIKTISGGGSTYLQASTLLTAVTQLSNTIENATYDADASPAFTEEQSLHIVQLAQTYAPLVLETCDDLEAKKDALWSFGAAVVYHLGTLKQDGDTFAAAVEAKVTVDQKAELRQLQDQVDGALTQAIDVFQ